MQTPASEQSERAAATAPSDDFSEMMGPGETCRFFGGDEKPIHLATLYRGVASGRYPKPVKVSANINRWVRSECVAARTALIAAPRSPRPRPPRRKKP